MDSLALEQNEGTNSIAGDILGVGSHGLNGTPVWDHPQGGAHVYRTLGDNVITLQSIQYAYASII